MKCWLYIALVGMTAASGVARADAQDTGSTSRAFVFEGRLGVTDALGASRMVVGQSAAAGATLAFQLSRRIWGWASVDYKPTDTYRYYLGQPAIGLYTLSAGLSRTFGMPFLPDRWRPIEFGLGLGATQTEIWPEPVWREDPPPSDMLPDGAGFRATSFQGWRPTAAMRLRLALPIGPLRLSATAGILATHVGGVQLWDGGWEPTGDGTRYRLTSAPWSPRTIYSVPLTAGLGFRF